MIHIGCILAIVGICLMGIGYKPNTINTSIGLKTDYVISQPPPEFIEALKKKTATMYGVYLTK